MSDGTEHGTRVWYSTATRTPHPRRGAWITPAEHAPGTFKAAPDIITDHVVNQVIAAAATAPPRRLAVVRCCTVTGEPDGTHLSVEEWSPRWGEWLTSMALCGQSAEQGALPGGTAISCTACEDFRDSYERALAGRPTAEQEELERLNARWRHWKRLAQDLEVDRDRHAGALLHATEFHIPCPEPKDPGRPDGAPILRPEPLIVRKVTANWADRFPDGWLILNPNLQPGDHVWTGDEWVYRGQLHMGVIYRWTRDEALALAPGLAAAETARYEAWIAEMRSSR